MKRILLAALAAALIFFSGIKEAKASEVSEALFGKTVTRVFPDNAILFSNSKGVADSGEMIPGGKFVFQVVLKDDRLRGLPYSLLLLAPDERSVQTMEALTPQGWVPFVPALQQEGRFRNAYLLEALRRREIKHLPKKKRPGGIISRKYRFTPVSGSYGIVLAAEKLHGSQSQCLIKKISFATKITSQRRVVRRKTVYYLDKDGKKFQLPSLDNNVPPSAAGEGEKISAPQESRGAVAIFGPAGCPVRLWAGAVPYQRNILPSGRVDFKDIPLGEALVQFWTGASWKSAGVVRLTADQPTGVISFELTPKSWLTAEEMENYLQLLQLLDKKNNSGGERQANAAAITRERIARGEWLYWQKLPRRTTQEDWAYLRTVREPRRKRQLLEMLALDVVHRGDDAFPYDRALTAGWGYELAYQLLTYMGKSWAVRDGAKWYRYCAPPTPARAQPKRVAVPLEVKRKGASAAPQSFARVVEEIVETSYWSPSSAPAETLGKTRVERTKKDGLLDEISRPLAAYLGRTRVSVGVSNFASAAGGSVGDVDNSNTNSAVAEGGAGGAGGSVGNIDVSATSDAAASASASAAASSN